MKRILYFTIGAAYAAAGVAFAAACDAQGVGGIAQVTIIDRDSGAVLSPYFYHGEYWVAGTPGARYAIEIRNRLTERVLAVASVDGVNVVTGATAGWDQAGYVFGPGERYQITGWRKSDAQVAAFTFTDSPNSYAGRTGRPANIGVIGVAVFRERPPQPVYSPPSISQTAPEASSRAPDAKAPARGIELGGRAPAQRGFEARPGRSGVPAGIGPAAGTLRPPRSSARATASVNPLTRPTPNSRECRPNRMRSSAFTTTVSTTYSRSASSSARVRCRRKPTPSQPRPRSTTCRIRRDEAALNCHTAVNDGLRAQVMRP